MSEYQYYEFRTLNRQLSSDERKKVDGLSSHGHTTATSFSVDYSWGDFKHNPNKVLSTYFDTFYYIANWGTVTFKLRFPKDLVNTSAWAPYTIESPEDMLIDHETVDDSVILTFESDTEDGFGWIEGSDALDGLSGLYDELLRGDLRVLYLGWLRAIQGGVEYSDYYDEETLEPPVPAGLDKLTPAQRDFVAEFGIDKDLLAVAAMGSALGEDVESINEVAALSTLTKDECVDYLHRFLQGEAHLEMKLKQQIGLLGSQSDSAENGTRTIGELFAGVNVAKEKRKKAAAAAKEAKRIAAMDALAARGDAVWEEIDSLIREGKRNAYDEAVTLLVRLRELASERGHAVQFEQHVASIRNQYGRRSSLMSAMNRAQL